MIEYLSVEEVITMHDAFLQEFGGLPGIRDFLLLKGCFCCNVGIQKP